MLRSRAERERAWKAIVAVMHEETAGDLDIEEAIYAWQPPTDDELSSELEGAIVELNCEKRGGTLPPMPRWLDELRGVTEVERWCLAVFANQADPIVVSPAAVLMHELEWNPVLDFDWTPSGVVEGLIRRGYLLGTAEAVRLRSRA